MQKKEKIIELDRPAEFIIRRLSVMSKSRIINPDTQRIRIANLNGRRHGLQNRASRI